MKLPFCERHSAPCKDDLRHFVPTCGQLNFGVDEACSAYAHTLLNIEFLCDVITPLSQHRITSKTTRRAARGRVLANASF